MNNDVTMDGRASVLASRYRIIKQLGSGGMGSVWLAEDIQLDGKLFAIKMLPSILVANKRAYAQLKSEALVAMKLVHTNIVQIRAFEENNGNPFLVMDYIDGETLDDWLGDRSQGSGRASVLASRSQGSGVGEDEIVRLLKPIAEALDYAHTEGVVHRDIKPANVMIRKDGRPFIMDFGIAREIQETMTFVTGKMSSGTLMYMSPEQLHGHAPKKFQDIYSFAAMVYECLTGRPPFCRGQIEYQIDHDDPEPLSNEIAIASSVMAGLAKKPEDRPASCVAIIEKKVYSAVKEKRSSSETVSQESNSNCDKAENTRLAIEACEAERWEEAFRLSENADRNDSTLQFYLGNMYAKGRGVTKDDYEAVKWFRKAAEQGIASAQFYLGNMYLDGEGVIKDDYEAVKWYRKSAEQGNAYAQCNLGIMYVNGRGVTKDECEAVKCFRKAAEQGDALAQYNLGWMYEAGRGVTKDESEAVKWYRKSAEQGDAYAQGNLGWMYQYGRGVTKDEYEAVKWYRKAAEQGYASAQSNLGLMYLNGCGVAKDDYEAVKWLRRAAEQGEAAAKKALKRFGY